MSRLTRYLTFLGIIGFGAATAETVTVPFNGVLMSDPVGIPIPPTPECPLHHEAIGSGFATHLGYFDLDGTTCGFNIHVENDPEFDPGGEPPYLAADFISDAVWTAPNGDQLFITVNGIFLQSVADGSSGVQVLIYVTGGTGRFVAATGEISGSRNVFQTDISLSGWLQYDASNISN